MAPTAIALASYFCLADIILISQVLYYNAKNARLNNRRGRRSSREDTISPDSTENSPLLGRRRSTSLGLPGSHRRAATHEESTLDPLRKVITGEDETPDSNPWLHNALGLFAVYAVGTLGWFISYKAGAWDTDPNVGTSPPLAEDEPAYQIGTVLGYISALCYLW